MSKDHGGGAAPSATPSLFAAAATKISRMGSSRGLSPSAPASKYRVSSLLAGTDTSIATSVGASQAHVQLGASSSPGARKVQDLVRQVSVKGMRRSVQFSDAAVMEEEQSQDAMAQTSPSRGRLPQKIRSSVTRMRSQLSLTSTNNTSESPTKTRQRHSSAFGLVAGPLPSSNAAVAAVASLRRRYSRQPQDTAARLIQEEPAQSTAQLSPSKATRPLPANNSDPAFVRRFMDLLRPLQSSMSSQRHAGDVSDENDEDEDEADALFRQHERENSRILRICCSLDNLLFAIADQVQEHNHDLLAIVRGPGQELVQWILNGIRQIVAAMATTSEHAATDGMPSLTAKEERYLRDFLVEIADRWSELDELVRGVYVSNLSSAQRELSELQTVHAELKMEKQTLELEVIDLREFNSNQSATTMAVTSNFMRLADQQDGHKRPESDDRDARHEEEHLAGYDLKENQGKEGEHRTAAEEFDILKKQCEEYGRLLEMAKQEIRLSHQERQSQHARLVELSESLMKDQEVAQLRNELQSEKKRVKLLEMESLSLRETQMDLTLKIQSLQLNHPSGGSSCASTFKTIANSRGQLAMGAATTPTQSRSRSGSAVMRPDDVTSVLAVAPDQHVAEGPSSHCAATDTSPCQETVSSEMSLPSSIFHANATQLDAKAPWLSRMIVVAETNTTESDDDGHVRRFLADLLMTDKEYEATVAQSKLRKRANVPTTGAPPASFGAGALPPVKKKKPKPTSALQDPNTVAVPIDEWVRDTVVVASVRQLIWVFYELYLMSEEARRIDPELCGRAKWHHTTASPVATLVLHYFLERHVSESDAVANLRRFVRVLSKLRIEYGDIQLFCDFLEGQRSREELNFFLWALQAIEAVELGINYDLDSSFATSPTRLGRCICTLKALYITRMIYQFLHMKSLKKPTTIVPPVAVKGRSNPTPVVDPRPPPQAAATSPSKKRRKSRPNSASALSTMAIATSAALAEEAAAVINQDPLDIPITQQAREQYAHAVGANSGYPLTLECFNKLVVSFADTPSREELHDRLGPFYQLTGDERKVALDVFLVLLMELFSSQLHHRKAQLVALFVRLAKEEEMAVLLAAKLRQQEEAVVAAQGKKTRGTQPEAKEKKKSKSSPSKKRQRRAGIDGSNEKYLRGLSRERFRQFVAQGGLVGDLTDHDMDALYVAVLEASNCTPSDIHFEDVYAALLRFEMVGNESCVVDFAAWEVHDRTRSHERQSDLEKVVVDQWRHMSSTAVVMTENDPNVYTRRAARHLLCRLTSPTSTSPKSCNAEMEMIHGMRSFLAFAWRVARRRTTTHADRRQQIDWCLTECFYLNQAIQTICGTDGHYASSTDLANVCKPSSQQHDRLAAVYDTQSLSHVLKNDSDDQMPKLQAVLQRYALYVTHLFDSYSAARHTSSAVGLTKDQWMAMAQDLELVKDRKLSTATCETLFMTMACTRETSNETTEGDTKPGHANVKPMQGGEEVVLDRPRFAALLVHVALVLHERRRKHKGSQGSTGSKKQDVALQVPEIVELFCREFVVPNAFGRRLDDAREVHFHRKLADPLVAKALLEHRAFLRQVFFHYAKVSDAEGAFDSQHGDVQVTSNPSETQRKSKHNSMVLAQFTTFLLAFDLLELRDAASSFVPPSHASLALRLDTDGAASLFRAVLAVESDDDTHMEFDEFAAAIAAIAALRNPHPFVMWHVKFDAFVRDLRQRASRVLGADRGAAAR